MLPQEGPHSASTVVGCSGRGLEARADPGWVLVGLGVGRGPSLHWDPGRVQVGYWGGLPAAGLILPVITGEEEREFVVTPIARSQVK